MSTRDQIKDIVDTVAQQFGVYKHVQFTSDYTDFLVKIEILDKGVFNPGIPTTVAGRKPKNGLYEVPGIPKICASLNIKLEKQSLSWIIKNSNELDINNKECFALTFIERWVTIGAGNPQPKLKKLVKSLLDKHIDTFDDIFRSQMEAAVPIAQAHYERYLKSHNATAAARATRAKVKKSIDGLAKTLKFHKINKTKEELIQAIALLRSWKFSRKSLNGMRAWINTYSGSSLMTEDDIQEAIDLAAVQEVMEI
jgi:hypothetical protein